MAIDVSSGRMQDTAGALAECAALEVELAELRAAYEQYFSGIERVAPLKRHEALKKRFKKLKSSFIRQTATKFRINSLHSKYLTYERQWEKIIQQREDGTYRPDLERARRRAQRQQGSAAQREAGKDGPGREVLELDIAEDVSLDDFDFSEFDKPAAPPPAATAPVEDEFDALLSSLTEAPTPAPLPKTTGSVPAGAAPTRPSSGSHPATSPSASERAAAPGSRTAGAGTSGMRPVSGAVPAVPRAAAGATGIASSARPSTGGVPAVAGASSARPSSGGVPAVAGASSARPSSGGVPAVGGASSARPSSGGVPAVGGAPSARASTGSVPAVAGGSSARATTGSVPAVAGASSARPSSGGVLAVAGASSARATTGSVPAVGGTSRSGGAPTSGPQRPVSTPASGVSDAKLKAVYDAYVNAKRRCNEDVSKLSFDRVASDLRREVGAVTQRSGAKSVEFKVVIKDGRAELRTLPKD